MVAGNVPPYDKDMAALHLHQNQVSFGLKIWPTSPENQYIGDLSSETHRHILESENDFIRC